MKKSECNLPQLGRFLRISTVLWEDHTLASEWRPVGQEQTGDKSPLEWEMTWPESEEWIALEGQGADQEEDSNPHKEVVTSSSQSEEWEKAKIMPDFGLRPG